MCIIGLIGPGLYRPGGGEAGAPARSRPFHVPRKMGPLKAAHAERSLFSFPTAQQAGRDEISVVGGAFNAMDASQALLPLPRRIREPTYLPVGKKSVPSASAAVLPGGAPVGPPGQVGLPLVSTGTNPLISTDLLGSAVT